MEGNMNDNQDNKYGTYLIGGFIGAIVGMLAAYLIDKSAELEGPEGEKSKFDGKKISKLSMNVVSLLWSLIQKGK
jgi:gas vesicle protein